MIVGGMEVKNVDVADLVDVFMGVIYEKNMLIRLKDKEIEELKRELEELKIKLKRIGEA